VTESSDHSFWARARVTLAPVAAVFRSLRNRDFRIYVLSGVPSLLTDWMTRVAVGWLAWELTHSATWLGILGFVELFPALIFGVFGGAVADRFDRPRLMAFCQFLQVTQSLGLVFFIYSDLMTIEALVALNLYFGMIKVLEQPTRHAMVPALVRTEDISTAIGFDSISFNTARIIGPAIAGGMIVTVGVGPIFIINTAAFGIFMAGMFFVRTIARERAEAEPNQGLYQSIKEGFRYVVDHPGIGPLMLVLAVVSVIARPMENFIPGFAGEVFLTGAEGQAALTAAMGFGAMSAGIFLTQRPSVRGLTGIFTAMTAGLGLALVLFTSNDLFLVGLPVMVLIGFTVLGVGLGARMLVQTATIPVMRGRVASLYGVILRGMGAVGAIGLGAIADVWGLRVTFFLAGLACLGTWLWMLRLKRVIRSALEAPPVLPDRSGKTA
jgi:MFS family permease